MNTIYTMAKDAMQKRGFTHLLAADGTKTLLNILANKTVRHPFPNGWAYHDRNGQPSISHYTDPRGKNCKCTGYYLLVKDPQ